MARSRDLEGPAFVGGAARALGGLWNVPVFEVELALRPPYDIDHNPVAWKLHLGARANWRLPFAVLFGQRGWFERFPTTIDSDSTVVRVF